jgi:hypothetical protein
LVAAANPYGFVFVFDGMYFFMVAGWLEEEASGIDTFVDQGASSYASPGSLCGSMLRAWVPVRSEMQCRGEEGNYSD